MENVEGEASLLLVATQNIIAIFDNDEDGANGDKNEDDDERALEAGQCIADHVRILVGESRGTELMTMMYADPFTRLLSLLWEKKREKNLSKTTSEVRNIDDASTLF